MLKQRLWYPHSLFLRLLILIFITKVWGHLLPADATLTGLITVIFQRRGLGIKFLLIKLYVYSPTAQTRTFPTPSITFDPERIKQESFFVFAIFTGTLEIMSDSPVTEDSSIFSSEPSTKIPSICNKSPIVTVRRSPTKSSLLSRYRVRLIIFMKFFEKF